ncbi:hypothetical protein [Methanobacterium sp.]|jgi:hypothetical protein|uniref:hypothetical protein n=1 Tax=Methanobacterium sp. TaxID=2164 RepID=UPI0031587A1C
MASSTAAILVFIYSVIILIISRVLTTFVPQLGTFSEIINGMGVASVVILPITSYFLIMAVSFFSGLLYNRITSRLCGIKLGLDNNEITQIPVKPFTLVIASIEAIWTLIIGLFLAAAIIPFTDLIIRLINFTANAIERSIDISGATLLINTVLGTNGVTLALILIIGLPLVAFVYGLVSNGLFAIFYNYIATKFIKMQLDIEVISGNLHEIKSLPVVAAAAPLSGAVFGAFGVIMGIITLLSLAVTGNPSVGNIINDITIIVLNGLSYFLGYFLIFALIAVIYNFLAPRIGGIMLKFE